MRKTLCPTVLILSTLISLMAGYPTYAADLSWQTSGQGPRPVGAAESFERNLRAGGLGLEVATDSFPRIFRRPVPYYGLGTFNGPLKQHLPQGDFGVIQPEGANFRVSTVKGSSWTHAQMRFEAVQADRWMDVFVSRVSPAVVFQTPADAMSLFAGGKAKPAYLATRAAGAVIVQSADKAGTIPLGELNKSWLLVWFGQQSDFRANDFPFPTDFRGWVPGPRYLADCPFLFVFQNNPKEIAAADGGMSVRFSGAAGSVAVLPLFGQFHPRAEETEEWSSGLPPHVVAACDWWAEHLSEVPLTATESYAHQETADRVTITTQVNFLRVRAGGKRFAPLPPMLAIAKAYGFPAKVSAPTVRTSVLTPYGPYEGIENSDSFSVEMTGLGKYALEPREVSKGAKTDETLRARLADEVRKVLDAGHLAAWYIAMTDFGAGYQYYWRMQHCLLWSNPGETLYILAQSLPLLPPDLAQRTKDYMRRERKDYPPEKVAHTPVAEGARRERYSLDPALLSEQQQRVGRSNFHVINRMVPEESIYYLAEYYRAMNEKPDAEEWKAIQAMLEPYLRPLDWASLGFFKRPGASQFTMQGPGGAPDANAHFAGLVGYVRLARMVGDVEAETLGWGLLARAAMLRFGMEKYPNYLQENRLYVLPQEPDWLIKFSRGSWSGRLYTYDWTRPLDDVRTIARMDQFGVQFDDTLDWYHGTGLPKLRGLTPELVRFFKDYLRPEVEAFVRRVEQNSPDWYLALANAFVGAEFYYQQPQESYAIFLAKAWILDEKPDQLEQYLDVPWMQRGDLYYVHKLTVCLEGK